MKIQQIIEKCIKERGLWKDRNFGKIVQITTFTIGGIFVIGEDDSFVKHLSTIDDLRDVCKAIWENWFGHWEEIVWLETPAERIKYLEDNANL